MTKEHTIYESKYAIGEPVYVFEIPGNIRVITFTTGKVRYGVQVQIGEDGPTTIHNIDSCFVTDRTSGDWIEYDFDNYS